MYISRCSEVPVVVFLMFCAEGDNAIEAFDLANRLNRWLNLIMFHVSHIVSFSLTKQNDLFLV